MAIADVITRSVNLEFGRWMYSVECRLRDLAKESCRKGQPMTRCLVAIAYKVFRQFWCDAAWLGLVLSRVGTFLRKRVGLRVLRVGGA